MWFSVALVKFYWFGINWHVFDQSECRNSCLYIIIQKIAPQAESGKCFLIWFFSLAEKMAAFWACACNLSWTDSWQSRSQSPRAFWSAPKRADQKGRGLWERDWNYSILLAHAQTECPYALHMLWTLFLSPPPPGSAPIGGGKKGEFRDWTRIRFVYHKYDYRPNWTTRSPITD